VTNIIHWEILTTATGFILGGVSYSIANLILERKSKSNASKNRHINGSDRKIPSDSKPASGRSLFIGSVMDNTPENAALGITLAAEGTVNVAFLVAIFVSDLSEGLGISLS
jgi:ZIP family zinc transporter